MPLLIDSQRAIATDVCKSNMQLSSGQLLVLEQGRGWWHWEFPLLGPCQQRSLPMQLRPASEALLPCDKICAVMHTTVCQMLLFCVRMPILPVVILHEFEFHVPAVLMLCRVERKLVSSPCSSIEMLILGTAKYTPIMLILSLDAANLFRTTVSSSAVVVWNEE